MAKQLPQATIDRIVALRHQRHGWTDIAATLNREGIKTLRGRDWRPWGVRRVALDHDPQIAEVAAHRHVTDDGVLYECGLCGRTSRGADMIVSGFTGARYCATDTNTCRDIRTANRAAGRVDMTQMVAS